MWLKFCTIVEQKCRFHWIYCSMLSPGSMFSVWHSKVLSACCVLHSATGSLAVCCLLALSFAALCLHLLFTFCVLHSDMFHILLNMIPMRCVHIFVRKDQYVNNISISYHCIKHYTAICAVKLKTRFNVFNTLKWNTTGTSTPS